MIPTALTIGGSDSSGGAGIQADLKSFAAMRVYGMSVITAVTAQSTRAVMEVFDVPADIVAAQIDAVITDIPTETVKTGMLSTAANVEIVAAKMREHQVRTLVVDPIAASSSGTSFLHPDGAHALQTKLVPLAFLITPNLDEAGMFLAGIVRSVKDMEAAARAIHEMGPRHVLIKGGHLEGEEMVDVLFDGKAITHFSSVRVDTPDSHGSGCVLSAAITANLALGLEVHDAVKAGKIFVTEALRNALRLGAGSGPCNPSA